MIDVPTLPDDVIQIVPFYTWPGNYDELQKRMKYLRRGDYVIIVSEQSGPESKSELLRKLVLELIKKGCHVYGYTHISRDFTKFPKVMRDAYLYRHWYGIYNMFVDEWPTDAPAYLANTLAFAFAGYRNTINGPNTLKHPTLIINPGARVTSSLKFFVKDVLIVTHENSFFPDVLAAPNTACILHSQQTPAFSTSVLIQAGWKHFYVTSDGPDGNPYDEQEAN